MSQNKRFLFVVNAKSNSGKIGSIFLRHWTAILDELPQSKYIIIENPSLLSAEISSRMHNYDCIVACGGDGTVRSVGEVLINSGVIMGVLPLGSGNDFFKTLGIKNSINDSLKALKKYNIRRVDVPIIGERPFFNTAGIGFNGDTNFRASKVKILKGGLKYTLAGFISLINAKLFNAKLNLDGKEYYQEFWMITFANGNYEGGKYHVSPSSSNSDGVLEAILFPKSNKIRFISNCIRALITGSLVEGMYQTVSFKNGNIKLNNRIKAHLDGEIVILDQELEIFISDNKLIVITN